MSILKDTLMKMYGENQDIADMLNQIDFTQLDCKFYAELFERISPTDYDAACHILASDLIFRYDTAIMQATMACTQDLNNLLDLITIPTTGRLN